MGGVGVLLPEMEEGDCMAGYYTGEMWEVATEKPLCSTGALPGLGELCLHIHPLPTDP